MAKHGVCFITQCSGSNLKASPHACLLHYSFFRHKHLELMPFGLSGIHIFQAEEIHAHVITKHSWSTTSQIILRLICLKIIDL